MRTAGRVQNGSARVCALPAAALHSPGGLRAMSGEQAAVAPPPQLQLRNKVIDAALMPFQREGVHFALEAGGRVLLGDEARATPCAYRR